jgi:hypothetical protein
MSESRASGPRFSRPVQWQRAEGRAAAPGVVADVTPPIRAQSDGKMLTNAKSECPEQGNSSKPCRRAAGPSADQREALLSARESGATLRQAAAAAGVHVATVCRWQARCPELHHQLHEVATEARREKYWRRDWRRPRVPWRDECPKCSASLQVRSAYGLLRFWRCSRWPYCPFASWRPRAPWDCSECGAACLWSHSRRSIGCTECGARVRISCA